MTVWIPCNERLPKIGERVLLSTNEGNLYIGKRCKPELIWQVMAKTRKKKRCNLWVYDPEAYTDDIDSLPKGEDCGFEKETRGIESILSVTSLNYDSHWEGVNAWMPLPEPYRGEEHDTD